MSAETWPHATRPTCFQKQRETPRAPKSPKPLSDRGQASGALPETHGRSQPSSGAETGGHGSCREPESNQTRRSERGLYVPRARAPPAAALVPLCDPAGQELPLSPHAEAVAATSWPKPAPCYLPVTRLGSRQLLAQALPPLHGGFGARWPSPRLSVRREALPWPIGAPISRKVSQGRAPCPVCASVTRPPWGDTRVGTLG